MVIRLTGVQKRIGVMGVAAILVASAVGMTLALRDKPVPVDYSITSLDIPNKELSSTESKEANKKDIANADVSSQSKPVVQQPVQTSVAPAASPSPIYGEDPTRPGVYIVFDKNAVMASAGIPQDQWQYVDPIVSTYGWSYKGTSDMYSMCGAVPRIKMQSAGADYDTNPVTQLKWCDSIVKARYGTWESALKFFNEHRSI